MGEHLIDGEFQSDKYPWCQRGFIPLKLTDPMAQPVLWEYAQNRESVDMEFADDLREALRLQGYTPPAAIAAASAKQRAVAAAEIPTPYDPRAKEWTDHGYAIPYNIRQQQEAYRRGLAAHEWLNEKGETQNGR